MKDLQQAYQSAKKELDEETKRKLIDEMKGYIKSTLQAIEDKKSSIAESQQELKALKADLEDLENGRLDKIKERQDKDPVARRVSVIKIITIINNYPSIQPYFQPYAPYWEGTISPSGSTVTFSTLNTLNSLSAYTANDVSGTYTVNCSNGNTKAFYIQG